MEKKYLFTWKLCFFLASNMYDKYPDKVIDQKIKKYKDFVNIDEIVNILFELKFNKMFVRVFSFLWTRIKQRVSLKKAA